MKEERKRRSVGENRKKKKGSFSSNHFIYKKLHFFNFVTSSRADSDLQQLVYMFHVIFKAS